MPATKETNKIINKETIAFLPDKVVIGNAARANVIEDITTSFSSMSAGVGLDVYNGFRNVYQLHRANLEILSSQFQLDDMKDDIKLLVANSYLQIMFNSEILKVQVN